MNNKKQGNCRQDAAFVNIRISKYVSINVYNKELVLQRRDAIINLQRTMNKNK